MEAKEFDYMFSWKGKRVPAYRYADYPFMNKKMEFRQSMFTFQQDMLILGTSNARGFVRPQVVVPGLTLNFNVHALSIPGATFFHARKALPLIPMLVRNVKMVVVIVGENDIRKRKKASTIESHAISLIKEIKTLFPHTRVMVHGILPGPDLDKEQVSVASSCLEKAAKHCKELFLESPDFSFTEWDWYDKKHLTASGLLKLWRNVEAKLSRSDERITAVGLRKPKAVDKKSIKFASTSSWKLSEKAKIKAFLMFDCKAKSVFFGNGKIGWANFRHGCHVQELLEKCKVPRKIVLESGVQFTIHPRYTHNLV